MVADHAVRQVAEDTIFGTNIQEQKSIAQYGFENVINSTIGALLDDQGKVITFDTVFETLRKFISIPTTDPVGLSNKLNKDNVFLVPLEMGLRFAVCAISEEKCRITPRLIKQAMDK